jgi:tumor protein p53-inducible protein 3
LFGGISIATCSSDEKCATAKNFGANHTINYSKSENVAQDVQKITEGKGVNIVLDCIAASWYKTTVESAGQDARWILYGTMGGNMFEQVDARLFMRKRIQLIPSTLRARPNAYKAELIKKFSDLVLPEFEKNNFKIFIDKAFLVDWKDAKPVRTIFGSTLIFFFV